MDWFTLGLIVFFALVALLTYYGSTVVAKRRQASIKAIADSLGLEFQAQTSPEQLELFRQISYFSRGHGHHILNHLSGTVDATSIRILDFNYTVSGGKSSTTLRQTVVALESPELDVPGFDLAPESIFTRFTEWFGVQDIDFANHPEFSQKFVLQANNEAGVRQLLDRELLDFLCKKPDIYLSVRQGLLCVYRPNKLAPPEQWKDRMAEGFEIYRQLVNRLARGT
ncbi:MAG: hypothetical protein JNL67_14665 [Planctomycetaceae bacterium]|nr:hypothetical protein [Planctomycetaceae bacterium]